MKENEKEHHVAWADRLGYNKIWAKNILDCNINFGTTHYATSVERLHNSMINISNGPKLKELVDDHKKKLENQIIEQFKEWAENNNKKAGNRANRRTKYNDLYYESCKLLYNYIIQLLEDNGFCFYESNIEEDEMQT